MHFFLQACRLHWRRMIASPLFFVFLLVMPVVALLFSMLSGSAQENIQINAAVLYDPSDELSARLVAYMQEDDRIELTLFDLSAKEGVLESVKKEDYHCAYYIHPGLAAQQDVSRLEHIAIVYKPPNALVDTILNECFYSAALKTFAPDVAAQLLANYLPLDVAEIQPLLAEYLLHYEAMDIYVKPEYQYLAGQGDPDGQQSGAFYALRARWFKGTQWLLVLVSMCFLSLRYLGHGERGILLRLTPQNRARYLYAFVSVCAGIFTAVFALCAFFVSRGDSGVLAPSEFLPEVALALVAYLGIAGICAVLLLVLRNGATLFGGIIFFLLTHVVLGSILVDMAELSVQLSAISCLFLSTHYLSAQSAGISLGLVVMVLADLALLLAIWGLSRRELRLDEAD